MNNEDEEILKEICDLVITMIYDTRISVEVREGYRKTINEKLKVIPLVSYDLVKQLR